MGWVKEGEEINQRTYMNTQWCGKGLGRQGLGAGGQRGQEIWEASVIVSIIKKKF